MFTDFSENRMLNAFFGRSNWGNTLGSNLFFAAFTSGPSDAGVGGVEVNGNGYSRVAVGRNTGNWAWADGVMSNVNEITWATATGDWGPVSHIALFSAASGGTMLAAQALTAPIEISQFSQLRLGAGEVKASISGTITLSFAQRLLDYFFRNVALSAPANIFVGFGLGLGSKNLAAEVAVWSYSRLRLANTASVFPAAVDGVKKVSGTHSFETVTTNEWGNLTHAGIFDGPGMVSASAYGTAGNPDDGFTVPSSAGFTKNDAVWLTASANSLSGVSNNAIHFIHSAPSATRLRLTSSINGAGYNAASGSITQAVIIPMANSLTDVTVDDTADTLATVDLHGLDVGDRVHITASVLPTGIVSSQLYWVTNATGNTLQIADTEDGSPIDIGSAGTAVKIRPTRMGSMLFSSQMQQPIPVTIGDAPFIVSDSLSISLD